MFNVFQCPVCQTSYGSFKEVWECVQWHPKFHTGENDKGPGPADEQT